MVVTVVVWGKKGRRMWDLHGTMRTKPGILPSLHTWLRLTRRRPHPVPGPEPGPAPVPEPGPGPVPEPGSGLLEGH